MLLVLYLAHLIVPAFLVVDSVSAWALGYIAFEPHKSHTAVLWIAGAWLVVGLAPLLILRDRERFLRWMRGPLVAIYAIYLCLPLLELFARAVVPVTSPVLALHRPRTKLVHDTDAFHFAGVHGRKTFSINEVGLRGPSLPAGAGTYRIVTIGGSTTACSVLDDREAWPYLLMGEMNAAQPQAPVWVGNAGVAAQNAVHHLVLLKTFPLLKKMDLLIFLFGINDFQATLFFRGAPTQRRLEGDAEVLPLYKRLELFSLGKAAVAALLLRFHPEAVDDEVAVRQRRQQGRVVALPDLEVGLREYRERVQQLARQCQKLRVRCMFVTQPTLWRADLPPEEQKLLWYGYLGRFDKPDGYLSVADLARGMAAYNRALLEVCEQNGLECYDLASVVPQDTTSFYDDAHFNEQGARFVAAELAHYLLSRPPFVKRAD